MGFDYTLEWEWMPSDEHQPVSEEDMRVRKQESGTATYQTKQSLHFYVEATESSLPLGLSPVSAQRSRWVYAGLLTFKSLFAYSIEQSTATSKNLQATFAKRRTPHQRTILEHAWWRAVAKKLGTDKPTGEGVNKEFARNHTPFCIFHRAFRNLYECFFLRLGF